MYTPNSCNQRGKFFYRPIDAAIRWRNLMVHESLILESATECPAVLSNTFPQWLNAYLGENGAHKGQRKPRSLARAARRDRGTNTSRTKRAGCIAPFKFFHMGTS